MNDINAKHKIPQKLIEAVNQIKRNKNILITKADKGGKVVVIDKSTYDEKIKDLLCDRTTYRSLTTNPLKKWQQKFNRELKTILKDNEELEKSFRSYLPSLPHLYGLPKIHKENIPMRPVISSINSVNYKLASWLSKLLSPALNRISGCHLNNTSEFIEKIRKLGIDNNVIVSFDVESLYTNIPVTETINLIENRLPELNLNLPISNDIFIKLIRIVVSECHFSYNNNHYTQIKGLPMGSPISPILANLFMEFFEKDLLSEPNMGIIKWYRYVDDVFALVPSSTEIEELNNKLNLRHTNIKFKYELEVNNRLPFLDCMVIKDVNSGHFKFDIYRKPSHCNNYIHAFSNHSANVKIGTMVNIFLRSFKICDPEFLSKEVKYIYKSFECLVIVKILLTNHILKLEKFFIVITYDNHLMCLIF